MKVKVAILGCSGRMGRNLIQAAIEHKSIELVGGSVRVGSSFENFDLGEIGTPHKFRWGKCKLATASYGHGITTTPLQLAKAYSILGNGGYTIKPHIEK